MNDEKDDSTGQRLEMVTKLAGLAYSLICLLYLMWMLIPEHKRKEMMMRAARTTALSAWRTASRAGHREMGLELSGCGTSYQLPYRLAQAALKAEQAYEKLRYTA